MLNSSHFCAWKATAEKPYENSSERVAKTAPDNEGSLCLGKQAEHDSHCQLLPV